MLLAHYLTGSLLSFAFVSVSLANAILLWLKCVDSTHYGYELNFQPIQLEAFIQASGIVSKTTRPDISEDPSSFGRI
jgi:hypothetical protein